MLAKYPWKTKPFKHQLDEWLVSRDAKTRAVFWEQGCVDATTEYLSPSGWRRMDDYSGGAVAQWHPDTLNIEFVKPTEYTVKPCSEMIRFRTQRGVDQLLSPEHRVPHYKKRTCEPVVSSAAELERDLRDAAHGTSRMLPATFHWCGGDGLEMTEVELRLQIAVMADGHFPKQCSTARCYMNLKKGRKKKRLLELVLGHGGPSRNLHVREGKDGYTHYGFDAPLRLKHYDARFWDCSSEQLAIIADEVWRWDGGKDPRNAALVFRSTIKESADFIQFAWASTGNLVTVALDCKDTWIVRRQSPRRTERRYIRGANISREAPIDGKKYCFTVPSTFLLFRRNGRIFPSGNTGKSKLVVDTAAWLYLGGKIDAMVVVAPNGVERNWIVDEVPTHCPDAVFRNTALHFYESKRAKTKWHTKACQDLVRHDGFAVLAMSYASIMTDAGSKMLKQFLTKRRCIYVLDESVAIKTPKAKRTKRILGSAKYAEYRRILTGTPVTNGAFDVYAPLRFLDADFWSDNGLGAFLIFKNYFGIFHEAFNGGTGKSFKQLVAFKNLEELHEMLARISTRVVKDDVLDLPPKLYSKRYVELTSEQSKIYQALKDEFIVMLDESNRFQEMTEEMLENYDPDSGQFREVTAPLAIVRLLRLQQIICGYVADDEGKMVELDGPNPRMDTLIELCGETHHKAIIWARFTKDIDMIMEHLGKQAVRYDGKTSTKARGEAIEAFQRGEAKFFVANPAAAGEGLTLHAARTVIYYNNSFKLGERLQSEDRAHRIGQEHPVNYIDLVCPGTVDKHIVGALRSKNDVAKIITGDRLKEWL